MGYNDKISVRAVKGRGVVVEVGYADLQCILKDSERLGYNCGMYGWNYDIYKLEDEKDYKATPVFIATGYRTPNCKYSLDGKHLQRLETRFKNQQKKLYDKWCKPPFWRKYNRMERKLKQRQLQYLYKWIMKNLSKIKN